MTIAQETPMDAACRLAAGALRHGFKLEALHAYTDCDANIRRPSESGFDR